MICVIKQATQKEKEYRETDLRVLYRIYARRARLFGLWVAEKMFLYGENAADYAHQLVVYDHDNNANQSIIDKAIEDLEKQNITSTKDEIIEQFHALFLISEDEILSEVDIYA